MQKKRTGPIQGHWMKQVFYFILFFTPNFLSLACADRGEGIWILSAPFQDVNIRDRKYLLLFPESSIAYVGLLLQWRTVVTNPVVVLDAAGTFVSDFVIFNLVYRNTLEKSS